jgi:hypothetical protein
MGGILLKFDPTNEAHVMWLKRASDSFKKSMREKHDFMKDINDNPICDEVIKPQDWAELHFVLAMKYTDAVFDGSAYIPK